MAKKFVSSTLDLVLRALASSLGSDEPVHMCRLTRALVAIMLKI